MVRTNIKVESVTVNGKKFYFADFGIEYRRNSFRLWIHRSLLEKQENENLILQFPIFARIDQGKKQTTLILRPDPNYWVVCVEIPCGFRGSSSFSVKEENVKVFPYRIFKSPRGNLGISDCGLIMIPSDLEMITIEWNRKGRLYGNPSRGILMIYKDGKIESVEGADLEDLKDLEDL